MHRKLRLYVVMHQQSYWLFYAKTFKIVNNSSWLCRNMGGDGFTIPVEIVSLDN